MPAQLAESPLTCVAVGSGRSLEEFEAIHRANAERRAPSPAALRSEAPMYRKQVRRRRAVLALLVVAFLLLISISISEAEDGPLHSVQSGVSTSSAPVGEGADRALKPARDLVNWFDETFDARGENDELKSQVAELRAELRGHPGRRREGQLAQDCSKLDRTRSGLTGYKPVDAHA